MLSGKVIQQLVEKGDLVIRPFSTAHVNPNSVNLTLDNTLKVYRKNYPIHQYYEELQVFGARTRFVAPPPSVLIEPLELGTKEETVDLTIPENGLVLYPGVLYLGKTVEWTETPHPYVPMLEGRSSTGRMGWSVHITAGVGDVGFRGHWVLEMTVVYPLRITRGLQVCQVMYHKVEGDTNPYRGRYQDQSDVVPSRLYVDTSASTS